jgi:hypothetical protein
MLRAAYQLVARLLDPEYRAQFSVDANGLYRTFDRLFFQMHTMHLTPVTLDSPKPMTDFGTLILVATYEVRRSLIRHPLGHPSTKQNNFKEARWSPATTAGT